MLKENRRNSHSDREHNGNSNGTFLEASGCQIIGHPKDNIEIEIFGSDDFEKPKPVLLFPEKSSKLLSHFSDVGKFVAMAYIFDFDFFGKKILANGNKLTHYYA